MDHFLYGNRNGLKTHPTLIVTIIQNQGNIAPPLP